MKTIFYSTRKNLVLLFLILQTLIFLLSFKLENSFVFWVKFELIAIGILCLWPRKPSSQMDEREVAVELKWKNRMLEFTYPIVVVPIAILLMNPNANGWLVLNSFTVPVFIILVTLSVLLRREQGGFFYELNESSSC